MPAALLLLLPLLFVGREVSAPTWLRERVEVEMAGLLDDGSVGFAAITVRVGRDLHPRIRLIDATLRDGDGQVLAHVPEIAAILSPRGLLARRILVQSLEIKGAEASLTRAGDGSVDLVVAAGASRSGPVESREGEAGRGLASIPERFEALFERPALAALRRVSIDGLVVNYDDARAGRTWTLDGGRLDLDLSGGQTHLVGEVSLLSGRTYVTEARLDYRSPRGSLAAEIGLTLTDVAAQDVASQSPALAWLGVVDAPLSLAVRISLDDAGRLGPLRAALKIADGSLRPQGGAPPVPFEVARAYLEYDPDERRLDFDRLEVRSEWGSFSAGGRAWLEEVSAGMPRILVGQFDLREAALSPPGLYEEPLLLSDATADLRVRLNPFSVEVVQATAVDAGDGVTEGLGLILASGRVGASAEGWRVAAEARLTDASRDRLLQVWPDRWRPGLRAWLDANVAAGRLSHATVALRIEPGQAAGLSATARFSELAVRPIWTHPPIREAAGRLSWDAGTLSIALESGWIDAPEGGALDLAGTALTLPPGVAARPPASVQIEAAGPITAALSLLDAPPLALMSSAGLPVDLAQGTVRAAGRADILIGPMTPDEARWQVGATLSGVTSDGIVPGRSLSADALTVTSTEAGVLIEGPVTLDGVEASARWSQSRDAPGTSRLEAEVALTPRGLATFGIALPDGAVSGSGRGSLTLDLPTGEAPRFAFSSSLEGLALRVPEMGWTKGAGASGLLEVSGRLGSPVAVDRLALSAPGLSAEGGLTLTAAGALETLDLDSLRVGDWFDAAVTLRARGPDATPGVEVRGGEIDLRTAEFGTGGEGEGGPISVRLDRLQLTDGIALTDLGADLSTVSGLEGTFQALVNGEAAVTGRVAPQGGRVGARIQGTDAGAVMRAADLFTRAEGGTLDLLLLPVGEASYDGEAYITGLKVVDAPVLASLLNAVSVVGLLQQLGGQGIVFDEVAATFRIDPTRVVVARSSAVGAGLGLSMDGVFDTAAYAMDFQGVFSPLYLINGIGQIFSRPGEGLIGFNYSLQGSPDDPVVGVNPLSALTPGMFRDIFRRAPPSQ